MVYQQILYGLFLFALMIEKGLSIQCYSCTSFNSTNCAAINEETPIVNCTEGETMCRKVEQHMNYEGNDHVRIFRQCATLGRPGGSCESRTGTYRFKSWYCHCNNADLCNGSGSMFLSLTLTIAMIAAIFEIKKLL